VALIAAESSFQRVKDAADASSSRPSHELRCSLTLDLVADQTACPTFSMGG